MTTPALSCPARPGCAGATVCDQCMAVGVQRLERKLLQNTLSEAQLPSMAQTVWPEASPQEHAAVIREMFKSGVAHKTKAGAVQHAVWLILDEMVQRATVPLDPTEFLRVRNAGQFSSLLTPARLRRAGLHQIPQRGTQRMLVRQKTFLNCVDKEGLEAALKTRAVLGTPMERVYEEYDGAHRDIFWLKDNGKVTIEEGMAWHAAFAPSSVPGALAAWRTIVGV